MSDNKKEVVMLEMYGCKLVKEDVLNSVIYRVRVGQVWFMSTSIASYALEVFTANVLRNKARKEGA